MEIAEHKAKSHLIMQDINRMIKTGALAPGTKIMSLRKLADEYGVGVNVMRHAMKLLEESNLVVSKHGSGTFVNPSARPSANRLAGLITSYKRDDIENYFEPLFEAASEMRVVPMVAQVSSASNWRQTVSDLVSRNPDEILVDIEARNFPLDELKELCAGIPLCFCNRWEWYPERPEDYGSAVLTDYKEAYAEGLRHLLNNGHRRIAIAVSHRKLRPFKQKELEYALKSNSLCFDSPEILLINREDVEASPEKIAAMLDSYAPTALFAQTDYLVARLEEIFPYIEQTERIGFFDLHFSRTRNHEFSSFNLSFKDVWTEALDPEQKGVQYLRPKLIERQNVNKQAIAV
ncbi:MAG: GntR family transcriptional regulator [Victivallales bacterium]|nr:GntR family transcriptional regulator [Victivallales bacterium]